MLRSLSINHIAVIQSAQIEFENGLNILTGETGAGKSIIIDALNMILGNRVSKNLIRTGEDTATVTAIFEVDQNVSHFLSENGYACDEGELMIFREISAAGKSSVRINGKPATASILKEISGSLVNIHGQHDNQSLMNPEKHLHILDEFCGDAYVRTIYQNCYSTYQSVKKAIKQIDTDEAEKERKHRILEFEVDEIENAKLKAGEEDELTERRDILSNAQAIMKNVLRAYELLYGASNNSAYENLGEAVKGLEQAEQYDASLKPVKDTAYDIYYNIESAADILRHYQDNFEYDENEINEIEQRLSQIHDLKRRYGNSIEEILSYAEKAKEELAAIQNHEARLNELNQQLAAAQNALVKAANALSDVRKTGAKKMEAMIEKELSDLNMPNTRFKVFFSEIEEPDHFYEFGKERVEFLLSANLGQDLDKLSKIASGGELSRIMLAIKSAVFEKDDVQTLIFDEIDTGVSGRAAQKIAEKLFQVSKNRQVLCVTHLPQIAAMADHHYLIEKSVQDDKTLTTVSILSMQEQIKEIARIIGGVKITGATLENAEEMLTLSKSFKEG